MARLVRCDRCQKDHVIDKGNFANVEFPILNRDEVEGGEKNFDFCFECLKSLWDWLRNGQNDARKRV